MQKCRRSASPPPEKGLLPSSGSRVQRLKVMEAARSSDTKQQIQGGNWTLLNLPPPPRSESRVVLPGPPSHLFCLKGLEYAH